MITFSKLHTTSKHNDSVFKTQNVIATDVPVHLPHESVLLNLLLGLKLRLSGQSQAVSVVFST